MEIAAEHYAHIRKAVGDAERLLLLLHPVLGDTTGLLTLAADAKSAAEILALPHEGFIEKPAYADLVNQYAAVIKLLVYSVGQCEEERRRIKPPVQLRGNSLSAFIASTSMATRALNALKCDRNTVEHIEEKLEGMARQLS